MDNSPPETDRPSPKSRFTRRSFLKAAALGGAAIAAKPALDALGTAATNWTKAGESSLPFLAEYSLEQLGSPAVRELLVYQARLLDKTSQEIIQSDPRISTLPEGERKKLALPNEHLRPIDQIILDGIKEYGSRITFQRNSNFKPLSFWGRFLTQEGPGLQPKGVAWDELDAKIPEFNLQRFIRFSRTNAASYIDFLLPIKSSFYNQVLRSSAEPDDYSYYPKMVSAWAYYVPDVVIESTKNWRYSAQDYLSTLFYDEGRKVPSASRLLAYFLNGNMGKLDCALWDTCIFLKMTARNDSYGAFLDQSDTPKKAKFDAVNETNAHCLDEYSISSNYSALCLAILSGIGVQLEDKNTELSALNRIGAPYHAFNDVALLTVFPAEVVIAGVIGEQTGNRNWQGPAKIASDLLVTARLAELEKYFISLPQS